MAAQKKAVKRVAAKRATVAKKSVRKASAGKTQVLDLALPRLGTPWKGQGGYFMGIVQGEKGQPDACLVLATLSGAVLNGRYGHTDALKGAESEHDGRGNTRAMAAAGSEIAKEALAAKIDGHADFYIPARHEARLCQLNGSALCKPEYHWTSTQARADSDYAWAQDCGNGSQGIYHKGDELPVRLVRRVAIR